MEPNFFAFTSPPEDFCSQREVSACYLACNDQFLLLKRHPHCSQGNRWCLPGGKIEKNEGAKAGIIREVKEEIGVILPLEKMRNLGKLFIRRDDAQYILHMFWTSYNFCPSICLKMDEHTEAKWVTYTQASQLPLITGGLKTLDHFLHLKSLQKGNS